MFFKSKHQKIIETYAELFNVVQIYGGVYGYLLRSGNTDEASVFKAKYDEWRKVSPLLVRDHHRLDACNILDELFNSATNNTNIIKEELTIEGVKEEEERLVNATHQIKKIVANYN